MINFVVPVPGEPEPRHFRYNTEEKALYTDTEFENKMGGMPDQGQVKITEANVQSDPMHLQYWQATQTHRRAYELCETEGIPLDEAMQIAVAESGRQPEMPELPPSGVNGAPPTLNKSALAEHYETLPEMRINQQAQTDPMAGIVITGQKMVIGMLFKLLEQYVDADDKNHHLVEHLKSEAEDLDQHEITI